MENYPDIFKSYSRESYLLIDIYSIRKLSRLQGTQSTTILSWMEYLDQTGLISNLYYSKNKRQARAQLQVPRLLALASPIEAK